MDTGRMLVLMEIPDAGSFTADNNIYFTFPNNSKLLRYKNARPVLYTLLIFFILGFFGTMQFRYVCWSISFILCSFYLYKDRYFYYYKKMVLQNSFSRYKQMMSYLGKILKSSKVYDHEMPLCYYVMKIKNLIETDNIDVAEKLIINALKEFPDDMLINYSKGVCLFLTGNTEEAVNCWKAIVKSEGINPEFKMELQSLLNEIY
jgi:tetratricopeptide (TPR) repeat protein